MIKRFFAATVVAAIALTTGSAMSHQTEGTDPRGAKCGANVTVVDATAAVPGPIVEDPVTVYPTFYVDVRAINENGYTWSIWIYAESNNHTGMQTRDGTPSDIDTTNVENCTTPHGNLAADLLIF